MSDSKDFLSSFISGTFHVYHLKADLPQLPPKLWLPRSTESKSSSSYYLHSSSLRLANGLSTTTRQSSTLNTSIAPTAFSISGEETKPTSSESSLKGLWYAFLKIVTYLELFFLWLPSKGNYWFSPFLKRFVNSRDDKSYKRKFELFLCGFCAGSFSQTVTYPCDVLRYSYSQFISRVRLAMQKDTFYYSSFFNAINKIYDAEGARGFFPGVLIALLVYSNNYIFLGTRLLPGKWVLPLHNFQRVLPRLLSLNCKN